MHDDNNRKCNLENNMGQWWLRDLGFYSSIGKEFKIQ